MVIYKKNYYQQSRDDVLQLIPKTCVKVLDVGCGFGALGKSIKENRHVKKLVGIERFEGSKDYLKDIYDKFYMCDIEEFKFSDKEGKFDCIIFADVLEHLVNPWKTLNYFVKFLSEDGKIIISIPNVRNAVILFRLIFNGRWKYEEHGIMDIGHLRFFTFKEINRMVKNASLNIERVKKNYDKYNVIKKFLLFFPSLLIKDLCVCQYIVRAAHINSNQIVL